MIKTGFGELIHKKPVSFQEICMGHGAWRMEGKKDVEVKFKKVKENTYGFEVGDYDRRYELIIDPVVLAYSTYLGGGDYDKGYGIAVDSSGYVYVTGMTSSTDFPTLDQYQTDQPNNDAFVTKIDPSQNGYLSLIYSTYMGGDSSESGYGIAVDGSGNAYITGLTYSTNFPILNQLQGDQPSTDGFLTRLDTTLSGSESLVYSTYLGGSEYDNGDEVVVDSSGNAYVTGRTDSPDFPVLNEYQTQTYPGSGFADSFVTRIDTNQSGTDSLLYSTYLGGDHHDYAKGIAVDSSGHAYVTGFTYSHNFPLLNQYQAHQAESDAFVTRIDTTQSGSACLIYSTCLGGNYRDAFAGIALDSSGCVYLTGNSSGDDFPTKNAFQAAHQGGLWDVVVAKIDTNQSGVNSLVYSTYLGGTDDDKGAGVAVYGSGHAYVIGYTDSANFPTLNQFQDHQGSTDAFVARIDTNRGGSSSLVYSTYLGGSAQEYGLGIGLDDIGNTYVCGNTYSPDFPTVNPYQTYQAGDAFVTKINAIVPPTVTTTAVSSITPNSASSGGEVTNDGGAEITARGACWSTSQNPTTDDSWTTDGSGTGIFTSSLTNLTPNTVYYVRAYATNSVGTAYGNEESFETLDPSITVTSPDGGEYWEVGSSHNITWTSDGVDDNVKIDYSTDSGQNWTEINASTLNDGIYSWEIPNDVSNQCLIRVSETDGSPSDICDNVFTIFPPSITVTSPNGGENWEVNSQLTINWNSIGTVGNVKIECSTNNGGNWTEIMASTENDGTHPWTVPDTVSSQCLVRVSETDGSPADTSDAVFTIFPPSITVTSPNGGESWVVDSQQTLTWTSIGTVGNVKIEYSFNNGGNWAEIIASTGNDGTHPWTVPGTVSNQCLIRVSETDGNPSDTSDGLFTILPPSLTVTSPNGGENWDAGSIYDITWTSEGTVGNVMIEYSINNGDSWRTIVQSTENDGSFNWNVPTTPSDKCLVRISETDEDGGASDISDALFSIVSPVSGSINVRSPNGGETWVAGSTQEIKWNSTGDINKVTIKYSTDNGTTWKAIAKNAANNHSYNWIVPDVVSDECLVRITSNDAFSDPKPSDVSNAVFSIGLPSSPPTITVIAPNGGEQLDVGSRINITWNSIQTREEVKIEYSVNGGQNWTIITDMVDNNGDYEWLVPDTPSETCLVRISETDGQPVDASDTVFSIVQPSPSYITVTSPNGGESWTVDSLQEIKWTSTGDINNVFIEYSKDNGTTWKTIVQTTSNNGSFDWIIPDTVSDECLVRITSNDGDPDPKPSDVSDRVFSIGLPSPTIRVIAPNGGEQLVIGSRFRITWYGTNTRKDVKIEYSVNGGETWVLITDVTENDGDYDWIIPDTPSETCLVRISETDGQPVDVSDAVFSIVQPLSDDITVTSPNGGESWTVDSLQEIKWTSTGDINNVFIEYSTDNGITWKMIVQTTANDGSFDWTIPDTVSDECLVRVTANDDDLDPKPSDFSDDLFSIVLSLPGEFRVTSPNGGEQWEVGSAQTITWTSSGDINNVMLEYSSDNGTTWSTIVSSTSNSGTYDWPVPDTISDECLVRVIANDGSGDPKPSDVSDEVFSIVLPSSPFITVTSPNGGEQWIINSIFSIIWLSNNSREEVKIEYSINGGDSWIEITGLTENDGEYDWTVPDEPSEICLVRISETDGEPVDVSDAVFSIVSPLPSDITVTTPNGGENLEAGTDYNITWTCSGLNSIIIEYSINNGASWLYIEKVPADNGLYTWTVPGTPSENCLVRVSGADSDEDPSDVSDGVFTIFDPSQAFIEVLTPNGGESLGVGEEYDITWASDGVNNVLIEYSTDNGDQWITINTVPAIGGRYIWTVPDTPSESCLIRISGSEPGEPPFDVSDAVFSILII